MVLIRRNSDLTTLITHGLQYLKQFGDNERFAGRTLALLSAPSSDQDDPDLARLDPALRAELEQELNAFYDKYPDSPYMRRRGGSSSLADLVNQFNKEGRPSQQLRDSADITLCNVIGRVALERALRQGRHTRPGGTGESTGRLGRPVGLGPD